MKQEELLKALVKELFALNELHQEYQDNDTHFVVDSSKEGNTLTIKVQLLENKDKKEFEKWIDTLDDDLFNEVWESLSEEDNLHTLNDLYNSKDYKQVITKFKSKTKEIAQRRIKELQKLISGQ
jgi:hypothetical protein